MYARMIRPILTAFLLSAPLGLALAAEKPEFSEVDADGDGEVSVSEATEVGVPEQEAKREDIDNDDALTKADWKFVDMNPDSGGGSGES